MPDRTLDPRPTADAAAAAVPAAAPTDAPAVDGSTDAPDMQGPAVPAPAVLGPAVPAVPAVPASPAQQGVWITERLGAARSGLHLPLRITFDRVDAAALAAACTTVAGRHPALRSVLVEHDGTLELRPSEAGFTVTEVDAAAGGPQGLAELLAEETVRPFALDAGPLVRFTLFHGLDGRADLLIVAHHAVFDGVSKDVLVADLAAAYNALVAGGGRGPEENSPAGQGHPVVPAPDPALVKEAADWFGPRWSDPADVLLPGIRRTARGAGSGQAVTRPLDHAALGAAARACGVTTFEFLLTAVHVLLRRYGNSDAPVALPLSTRTPELAEAIGLFVNELPHHAPPAGEAAPGFAEFAVAVRAGLRELYRFRTVPFGAAVGGLTPRVGLTPVSFGYRCRTGEPVFTGTDARVDWMAFNHTARNTLHLQVVDAPDDCQLSLQYDPAVLAPEAAHRIAGHFETLLAAAIADPATAVDALPLLDAAEHRLVTEGWNDTARPYPADRTVVDLFDAQAEATPEAIAVTAADASLRYRELRERSVELAGRLAALGVGPGSLVALHLDRASRLPAALLAVLRTGAGYLPLDPSHPADRLAFVLADAGAALLLADGEPAAEVAAAAPVVVRLDEQKGAGEPTGRVTAPGPQDRAYVLYTSGSTGRPKGVAVGHRALVNLLSSFADRLGSGPDDVWLGLTSLSFDISGLELYLPLITGGRLVLAPDGLALDGPGLNALIGREGVTHVQATPSGWRVLLSGAEGPGPGAVTGLVGGEALPLPLARELRARTARLFNVYGPTETTIWSTCAELPAGPETVGIGRPIANTRAYVLDPHRRPLPVGVAGELYLGGDGVAHGYLGRPELTAERFVEDPFGPPGSRLYRTGDLAAWTAEGELDFLGRIDHQVKIRGHRIELGEIEARLLEHPAVTEAAVTVDVDATGAARLVGHLVARPAAGEPPTPAELREHLRRTLPASMVPQLFVLLAAMPLTPNGKLDRRALRVPTGTEAATAGRSAAAQVVVDQSAVDQSAAAQVVVESEAVEPEGAEPGVGTASDPLVVELGVICSEVLGIPDITADEDLFDLGAHSLMFIQIGARIRKSFGVEVDLDVFFDTPTVAEIAEAVKEQL
ncbi:amino acid adenylation domain-containing protein [Kitasatospora sp. RG8]|uniref:non-ribosomal peptide synthetase n=1 Tax=Kitasatospora sp. RG8 TaxID=2820815 RepID=UPI001FD7860A|nr:amino acid adenylation domain-containing protein [Kitasatospora sp. RG8]